MTIYYTFDSTRSRFERHGPSDAVLADCESLHVSDDLLELVHYRSQWLVANVDVAVDPEPNPEEALLGALVEEDEPTSRSPELSADRLEHVRHLIGCISDVDRMLLHLHHFEGYCQQYLAELVGLTQPGVCDRMKVARNKIAEFSTLPWITGDRMRAVLARDGLLVWWSAPAPRIDACFDVLWRHHAQSRAARKHGISQGAVRHSLQRAHQVFRGRPRLDPDASIVFRWIDTLLSDGWRWSFTEPRTKR